MGKGAVKRTLLVPHFRLAAYQRWIASTGKYFWKFAKVLRAAIFRTHLDDFFKYKMQRKSFFLLNAYHEKEFWHQ